MRRLQYTALHKAVLEQRISQIRLLLQQSSRDQINARDLQGRSPLMLSCIVGSEQSSRSMLQLLLRSGADATLKDARGRTALALACMLNRESLVTMLARYSILDATEPDCDGRTPLHHAAVCDNWHVISLLVQACKDNGSDIDCRDRLGVTPLIEACRLGHFRCGLYLLVDGAASVNIKDNVYFLNAYEWATRAASLPPPLLPSHEQQQLLLLTQPANIQRNQTQVMGAALFLTEQSRVSEQRRPQLQRQRTLPSMPTHSRRSVTTTASSCDSNASTGTLCVDVDEISWREARKLLFERLRVQVQPQLEQDEQQQQHQQQQQQKQQQRPNTQQLRSLQSRWSSSRRRRCNEVAGACRLLGLLHAEASSVRPARPLARVKLLEADSHDADSAERQHSDLQQQFTERKSVSFKESLQM